MRLIKTFGLAALTALAAMAFVGASSATAESSLLCTNDTATLSPTAAECAEPMEVHYVSEGKATLLTPLINVKCNVLLRADVLLGLVTNGPVVLHAAAGDLTYTNCGLVCSVTTTQGGLIEALKEGSELAKITATGFQVEVNCGVGSIQCTYNPTNLVGHGLGPLSTLDNGHVTYEEAEVVGTGTLCPTSKLDALFVSLSPLYIRS